MDLSFGGSIYDTWLVCDWRVRCWDQESTQVLTLVGVSDWGVSVWSNGAVVSSSEFVSQVRFFSK